MAFAHPHRLGSSFSRPTAGVLDDAAGFTSCCGLASCSTPLRTPPLSTDAGGFATGDPGVSPDRTHTGWLIVSLSLGYVMTTSLLVMAPELLDARGSRFSSGRTNGTGPPMTRQRATHPPELHGRNRLQAALSVAIEATWSERRDVGNNGLPLIASASDAPTVRTGTDAHPERELPMLCSRARTCLVASTDPLILGLDVGAIALTNRA